MLTRRLIFDYFTLKRPLVGGIRTFATNSPLADAENGDFPPSASKASDVRPPSKHSSSLSGGSQGQEQSEFIEVLGVTYKRDDYTNVTENLKKLTQRKLHLTRYNPLNLLTLRIRDYFYGNFKNRYSSPLYSFVDNLSPVVTVQQNFDSLLVPADHSSRKPNETYYVNRDHVLRAHTSAHQQELICSGLDHFLVLGDVYRRDEIDKNHFPCFHQLEGVSLFNEQELFHTADSNKTLKLFENGERTAEKQETHTYDCAKIVEQHLKFVLEGLMRSLFGADVQCRWVEAYFPFTHPSFELEIFYNGEWLEMLGSGVIEQKILELAGVDYKVGWAFGMGLERMAMKLYDISDIRLFWSKDSAFLSQFETDDHHKPIIYKPISKFPKRINDMSMWLPPDDENNSKYSTPNFYDLVRSIGGDVIERVEMLDDYRDPKTGKKSHCYRITYRHMERNLTQEEVSVIHNNIADTAEKEFSVVIRR